jgi:hypothetical protein
VVPITWCIFHYMVPLGERVKAEMVRGGSEKTDYRTLRGCLFSLFASQE